MGSIISIVTRLYTTTSNVSVSEIRCMVCTYICMVYMYVCKYVGRYACMYSMVCVCMLEDTCYLDLTTLTNGTHVSV